MRQQNNVRWQAMPSSHMVSNPDIVVVKDLYFCQVAPQHVYRRDNLNQETLKPIRFEPEGPVNQGLSLWDPIDPADLASGTPVQHGHTYHEDPQSGYLTGVWHCTPMTEKFGPYAVHEFMFLLEGSVTMITADGTETTVGAGQAFVIPKGLECQWQQTESVRKYFMIFENPGAQPASNVSDLGIIVPKPHGPENGMTIETMAETANILGSIPTQKNHTYFEDPSHQMTCGVWQTTPFETAPVNFTRNELMVILEGSVTLTDSDGAEHTFKAGDAAYIPKGAIVGWKCTEPVRKFYSIYEPGGITD